MLDKLSGDNQMKSLRSFQALTSALVLTGFALAQQPAPTPAIPPSGFPGLDHYRASRIAIFTDDFGELARYRDANAALAPSAAGENRVVFFGDSITDIWKLPDYFPGKPYINRGIGGQTTPQMLIRFRQDAVALRPRVAVILAGTNDIGGNTGPMRLDDIAANLASMADIARTNGIPAVFSSLLPPAHRETPLSRFNLLKHPLDAVLALNAWLAGHCTAHGLAFIDYYSAMSGPDGL